MLSLYSFIKYNKVACFIFISDDLAVGINIVHSFSFQAVNNAFFSVDSFFLLRYGKILINNNNGC